MTIENLPYQRLDWNAVKRMGDTQAAGVLDEALKALDGLSKSIFIQKGLILLEVQTRKLWEHLTDPTTGAPYRSFEKWVVTAADYSRRDCFYALAAAKELRDIPVRELSQMPRCNIALMQTLSSGVRQRPEVIEAAKRLPERDFVAKVQADYPNEHIESSRAVLMPQGRADKLDEAIERATAIYGCKSRSEAIEAIAADFLESHPIEWSEEQPA